MAAFDLTKQPPWIKVDSGNYYTITSARITAVGMTRFSGITEQFYRDIGQTLSGDFQIQFSCKMTAASATLGFYPIIVVDDSIPQAINQVTLAGFCNTSNGAIYLQEFWGGYFQQQISTSVLVNNTEYWYTFGRVGTLFTCTIYTNASRTTALTALNLQVKGIPKYYNKIYLENNYVDNTAGSGTTFVDSVAVSGWSELSGTVVDRGFAVDVNPPAKWVTTAPTFSAPSAVTITLNNLAASGTATSNIIDNSVTRYEEVELEVYSTFTGVTSAEPCWLDIKILKSIDGTNFGTVDCCNLTLPALNFVNASPQRYTARFKAPKYWKLVVINHVGGSLQASGNTASFIGINPVFRL